MSEELSKLDLLIKVMKMTSAEDAVALVALRKADAILKAEGWDWERLLRGKVKVVADPFASGPQVAASQPKAAPMAAKPRPAPMKPAYQPPPPPPPTSASDPWAGMSGAVHAAMKGAKHAANYGASTATQQKQYPTPTPAPPMFVRSSRGDWCVGMTSTLMPGVVVNVKKRDGTTDDVTIGNFVERSPGGWWLYAIARTPGQKFKAKVADTNTISDL